jgi:hypothetical protein
MNRSLTGTILWVCLAGAMGATLFFIKHEVKDLESRLGAVHHDIARNEDEIHVLNAEWSYLNDPARLRDLAERHLSMKQMGPAQVATLDSLSSGTALVLEQRTHGTAAAHMAATAPAQTAATSRVALADARQGNAPVPQSRPSQANAAPGNKPATARAHPGQPSGLAMASSLVEAR